MANKSETIYDTNGKEVKVIRVSIEEETPIRYKRNQKQATRRVEVTVTIEEPVKEERKFRRFFQKLFSKNPVTEEVTS